MEKGNKTERIKTAIVYRSMPAEVKKEKVYSFTVTEEQAQFISMYKKEINFSATFRQYLDSIIAQHSADTKNK